MIVLDALTQPAHPKQPCALSIGSFDGVHKGHQSLLQQMRSLIGESGSLCVVTFSNHPSQVIPGAQPAKLILTKKQKLHWLEAFGIDITYCVPFTAELASLSYQEFLEIMQQSCPFQHLVLGKDAHLGNRREGTPQRVAAFCNTKGIQTHYIEKLGSENELVSSRRIRKLIALGDNSGAFELMGHPFE